MHVMFIGWHRGVFAFAVCVLFCFSWLLFIAGVCWTGDQLLDDADLQFTAVQLNCSSCFLPDAAVVPFGHTYKTDVCRDATPHPVSRLANAVGQLDFPYNLTLTSWFCPFRLDCLGIHCRPRDKPSFVAAYRDWKARRMICISNCWDFAVRSFLHSMYLNAVIDSSQGVDFFSLLPA